MGDGKADSTIASRRLKENVDTQKQKSIVCKIVFQRV